MQVAPFRQVFTEEQSVGSLKWWIFFRLKNSFVYANNKFYLNQTEKWLMIWIVLEYWLMLMLVQLWYKLIKQYNIKIIQI